MGFTRHLWAALAGLALLALAAAPAQAEDRSYLLATASTGGTYYPVGVAIATLTKVKLQPEHGLGISAINSAGSAENVKLLRDGEAQLAILQGLYGSWAWNGTGDLAEQGPQRFLRAVTMLWENVEQFVVDARHADTGTMADLAALEAGTLALGKRNSGTLGSNRTLLANLGIQLEGFDLFHAGYGPSAQALQNRRVDGVSTPAGVPTGALTRLFAAAGDRVRPLAFTSEQQRRADGGLGLWSEYVIPAGTYPGQNEDWVTIAQPNFLAVRADLPEEDVYLLTKTLYENLPFLHAIHQATRAMDLERALAGLPMPLHPGAERYFREAGLAIPARLAAD
jgi:hypothetical protein